MFFKFYNLDTFKKQIDVNFIDLDSELVDLNYKVASLIFCHVWRSIGIRYLNPLVLLVLLISLNLTYSNAIRLLFVQTVTSLTLTPGSRSAANAVGHVFFYSVLLAGNCWY